MFNNEISQGRRGFFKKTLLGIASLLFLNPRKLFPQSIFSGLLGKNKFAGVKGRIIVATDLHYSKKNDSQKRFETAKLLLNKSLSELTGVKNIKTAWGKVAGRDDVVGLKLNCVAAPNLSPSKELVDAIIEGLKLAQVNENNIIIFDRSNRELERGGFKINSSSSGVRCFGTDALSEPFQNEIETSGSVGSLFSNIISKICTVVINVGVLKDHNLSGVCAGMKNFYGVIHNPNKYHDNNCNPYIADLCSHKYIKDKLRLTVIDSIVCQYNGGPGYNLKWCVDFNSLIVGVDMVAVDRVAHDIIETERKKYGLPTLREDKRYPAFIDTASKMGLGEGDLNKIKVVRI